MRMQCEICGQWRGRRPKKTPPQMWKVHKGVSIPYTPPIPPFVCGVCRTTTPPDDMRCTGNNSLGKRCGHWCLDYIEYCAHHKPKEDEV